MKPAAAVPLKRNAPLYQQAYQAIKQDILKGTFAPGSKLIESALVERLKISRTPLREAIRQLQQEGLVYYDNVSATVVDLNRRDFEELCQCRLTLEKEIMRTILQELTDHQIETLENVLVQAEKVVSQGDYLQVIEANARFHDTILSFCTNRRLANLLTQTRSLLLLYRVNLMKFPRHREEIIRDLRQIFNSIKEKDLQKAHEAQEKHVQGDLRRSKSIWQ